MKTGAKVIRNQQGVTLIELLVAGVISLIAMVAIYQVYISAIRVNAVQDQVSDLQQNVRVSLDQIVRELRLAGYVPDEPTGIAPIRGESAIPAGPLVGNVIKLSDGNFFELQGDIDNDGLVEYVKYEWDNSDTDHPWLVRTEEENGGHGPITAKFIENIEELQFTFYDVGGVLTETPGNVKRVTVMVRGRTDREDPHYEAPAPYSDGYRRRTLESDVSLRNASPGNDTTPPACPSNVTVSDTAQCQVVQVNWTVPSDLDGDLEGYYIFYSESVIPVGQDPTTLIAKFANVSDETATTWALSLPIDPPPAGTPFYIGMVSYDRSGNLCTPVELSTPASITPTGNLKPTDPTNPKATPTTNQVAIEWGPVTDSVDIIGYRLYRNTVDDSGTATVIVNESDLTVTQTSTTAPIHITDYIDNDLNTAAGGPLDCNLYYYWVSAVDSCVVGDPVNGESNLVPVLAYDPNTGSDKPGVTPPNNDKRPPTPTLISLAAGDDTSTIIIDWSVPAPGVDNSTPKKVTIYWRPLGTPTWTDPAVDSREIDLTTISLPATGQEIVNGLLGDTIYEVKATTTDDPVTDCENSVDSTVGQISTGACAPQIRAHKIVPGIDAFGSSIADYDEIGTDPSITPTTNPEQYMTWVVDPTDCTPTSAFFDDPGFDFGNPPLYDDVSDEAHVEFFINDSGGPDTAAHTVYPVGTSGANPGNAVHVTNAGDNIDYAPRGADGFYHFPSDPLDPVHIDTFEFCDADYEFKVRVVDGETFTSEATIPLTIKNGGIIVDDNVAIVSDFDTTQDIHHIVTFGIENTNPLANLQLNKIKFSWTNNSALLESATILDSGGSPIGGWDFLTGTPAGRQSISQELTISGSPVIPPATQGSIILVFAKSDGTVNSEVEMRNETVTIQDLEIQNVLNGKVCTASLSGSDGDVPVPLDPKIEAKDTIQDQPTPAFKPRSTVGSDTALSLDPPDVNITVQLDKDPPAGLDMTRTKIRYQLTSDARSLSPNRPNALGGISGSPDGSVWDELPLAYNGGTKKLTGTIPSTGSFLKKQVWYFIEVVDNEGNSDLQPDNFAPNQDAFTYTTCTGDLPTVTLIDPPDLSTQTGTTTAHVEVSGTPYAMTGVILIVDGKGNIPDQSLPMSKISADGVLPQVWEVDYSAGSSFLPHTVTARGEDVCSVVVFSAIHNIN